MTTTTQSSLEQQIENVLELAAHYCETPRAENETVKAFAERAAQDVEEHIDSLGELLDDLLHIASQRAD